MYRRKDILYTFLSLVLLCLDGYAADIAVMTDRDPVMLNESFQLIFESDVSVDAEPDFSPLQKDFQILSTSTSTNMSIINGKISNTKRWTLTVLARRAGRLVIPVISFGRDKSRSASITVSKSARGGTSLNNNRQVFIEVEANVERPYVQSEVIYKIRLFHSVPMTNAVLSDPEINGGNAIIERLGEDKSYETRLQGKRYGVIERIFAIYPQTSGRVNIEPIRFQAQISQGSVFFNNPFGPQPKTIVIESEPVVLNILAVPGDFKGSHWLPARQLTVNEEWSETPAVFKLGEPITRTLTIIAEGLTASQFPEFPGWLESAFKQYPDQPVLTNDKNYSGISGTRIEKTAIIPNQTGEFIIPAIRIPWWNTTTDRQEYAEIPERRIKVEAGIASSPQNLPNLTPVPLDKLSLPTTEEAPENDMENQGQGLSALNDREQNPSRVWQWLSMFLLLAWLMTLFMFWSARRIRHSGINQKATDDSRRRIVKQIKDACLQNDPVKAKEALLRWGKSVWPDRSPAGLGEIGNRCNQALADELRLLSSVLYGRMDMEWDGGALWQEFNETAKTFDKKVKSDRGNLQPLYKI